VGQTTLPVFYLHQLDSTRRPVKVSDILKA
jgi:hypothetical protein